MAEIKFNNIYDQMSGAVKNYYDGAFMGQSFADQYDPGKRTVNADGTVTDTNPNSLTMKEGYNQMVDAYNQEQQSETKNSFLGSLANFGSADAAMPDQTYGLQDSMMGMSINPDGSLNYNNTQPQNLGFRSMVDMANDANNFDSQFSYPASQPQNLGFIESAPQPKEAIYQDRIMNNNLPSYGYEPQQYRIRDQLARDFLQGGILKDARKSLGETFGPIGNKIGSGLGSLKEFAMNKGTQGFNLGKMALSGIGNAIMPGLGFVLSNLKPEPLFRETLANSRKANPLGTRGVGPNGVQLDGVSDFGGFTTDDLGRITNNGLNYNTPEGIMSGYNAGFDLAGSALGRIGTIQNAIEKGRFKDKFALDRANKKIDNLKTAAVASAQAKRQAYQDKIDNAKNQAAQDRARVKSITAGYGGHDNSPGATGPTAAGAGMGIGGGYASDYGFKKDGGMIGYRNGGLASMFTRRR